MNLADILSFLPEVKKSPTKLGFSEKLKWTIIILVAFFILSVIPLYGLGENALTQFEQISVILGASFGSILSLGIGPIVTASIVLQLLAGSGILKLDTTTTEGRAYFQSLQKALTLFFVLFEAAVYVFLGGLSPALELRGTPDFFSLQLLLIFQLIVGGLLIMFMDDVTTKWGFGSGVSLFIAAGVSAEIFIRAFSPLNSIGEWAFGSGQAPVGAVLVFFKSLLEGAPQEALLSLAAILATILIFVLSVYAQAMKVEIPLSFGRVRGFGYRWPLNFLYTSNMPVILVAALLANIQLWARLLQNWGYPLLGTFTGTTPATGIVLWLDIPRITQNLLIGAFTAFDLGQAAVYTLFLIVGSTIFSIFWVQTSGMDAAKQAKQIMASGLQIPGFRRDERIVEHLLQRYIFPLTIMGGATIGLLAASADLLGALSRGTGILLTVMIIYRLYEDIAKQHMMDMHPALRKMMGGES
ncbi:MAG TPA: preprotein translocase subunit SecY [Candidatus Nanoarchaeia archaeon]|nr:preprotein translocase subunit SecY [Candidatus Nanoarchaeia archaeon]